MDSRPLNERRKHPRVYRNFIMSYHEKGRSMLKHNVSQVNNISQGGLSFSATHPVKEGAVIVIDLKTLFLSDALKLEGVVLECREKVPQVIYEVRLCFHELPKHARAVLEKIETYARGKKD